MDQSISDIRAFFAKARSKASARLKPFVLEMEDISVKRAKKLISDAQANVKMRACCAKNGVNPSVIDSSYFEAQGIKNINVGNKPLDFNPYKKGKQTKPNLKFKAVGIDFNGKKPNRKTKPSINVGVTGFKPVNLFKNNGMPTNPRGNVKLPNFNIKMPTMQHKKHQGRFEAVDLFSGPKGSNQVFIKPVFPGQSVRPKRAMKKSRGISKPKIKAGFNIKPIKFKGLF